jgi:hypothetical protein
VTIAPIAPTILKTGGGYGAGTGAWVDGFGDEGGGSDDGLWGAGAMGGRWWGSGSGVRGEQGGKDGEDDNRGRESRDSGGTPVELVYVPPFGSNYSVRLGRDRERDREREREYATHGGSVSAREVRDVMEDHEDGMGNGARGVVYRSASDQGLYHPEHQGVFGVGTGSGDRGVYTRRRGSMFSVGVAGDDEVDPDAEPAVVIPTVVVPRDDPYDYFEGPDMGDVMPHAQGRGRRVRSAGTLGLGLGGEKTSAPFGEGERSRSRSRSRTPSPAIISPSTSIDASSPVSVTPPAESSSTAPMTVPNARRSASASPPITGASLLAPPARGRGSSSQTDLQQVRGRSSARTASGSGSSSLGRAGSSGSLGRVASSGSLGRAGSSSSFGSLSPEGIVGGVYAGGREGKERDLCVGRERGGRDSRESRSDGGRESRSDDAGERRGRDRTGKRLSTSLSPDDLLVLHTPSASPTVHRETPRLNIVTQPSAPSASSSSSASSASSSATIVPTPVYRTPSTTTATPTPVSTPPMSIPTAEEEKQRYLQPTPSNSPIIMMQGHPGAGKGVLVPSPAKHSPKTKSPLSVPAPHPAEPSTSYSVSPPRVHSPSPSPSTGATSPEPASPRSPMRGDATIVGKAVGMVSSAGAFLGLWNGPV